MHVPFQRQAFISRRQKSFRLRGFSFMVQELNSVNISLDFLSVCEAAAIEAARTMGMGDRKESDRVAVEAMREKMDAVPMRGRIVIGEGERDEAPMLFIGEEVGEGFHQDVNAEDFPEIEIPVDPLGGTNLFP